MVSKNTLGISFFTRKHRGNETKVPIYARITVNGKRTELSVKLDVNPNNWNNDKGSTKGTCDEIKELSTLLEQIHSRIVASYQELVVNNIPVTADAVKCKYLGVEKKENTLMYAVKHHNKEMKGVLAENNLKNYETTERFLENYLRAIYKTSDLYLSQVNYAFLVGFEKYLKDRKPKGKRPPCKNNGAMKHIVRLKKILNLAIKNEWLDRNPCRSFKISYIKSTRKHLSEEEMIVIEEKELSTKRLERVKDLYVFSFYTGLAYKESHNLRPESVIKGIDGEYWLSIRRSKTQEPIKVPLLFKALQIIEKYKNDPAVLLTGKLLPSFSNSDVNKLLKNIATECGITKNLTFHMARHTFATIVTLTNGVPIETVSKMLGHTSIKTTQIYARVIEEKISNDMQNLRLVLDNKLKIEQQEKQAS